MLRLLVLLLVRPDLLLGLVLSLAAVLGLLGRPDLFHSLALPLAVVIAPLAHPVVPPLGRRVFLPRD